MSASRRPAPTSPSSGVLRRSGSRRAVDIARGTAAAAVLVGTTLGVPVALTALGAALPVDLASLRPDLLARPDDGRLLVLALLALAWGAWAVTVVSVGLEAWSALRRRPCPALPGLGGLQRAVAALVAAVTVAVATSGAAAAVPVDVTGDGLSVAVARASAGPVEQPAAVPVVVLGDPASGEARRASLPTITTQRHDTLWMLAEQHLGRGERFTEILEINRGVPQADGRALGGDGRLYPGWVLALPGDARLDAPRPERHRVVVGDTLWDIAEHELGDPLRYPEIAEANDGDLQPDGRQLSDPNLIMPGWVLEIPSEPAERGSSDRPGAAIPPLDRSVAAGAPPGTQPPGGSTAESPTESPADASGGRPAGSPTGSGTATPTDSSAESPTSGITPDDRSPEESAAPVLPSDSSAPVPEALPGDGTPADDDVIVIDRAGLSLPEPGVPMPSGGTLAVLALAGIAAELVRRRRQFQKYRRPGERMPQLDLRTRRVEAAARRAAAEPDQETLDRSLTQLAHEAWRRGSTLPDVRLVRVCGGSVVVEMASPRGELLPPFGRTGAERWELDASLLAADVPDHPRAFPALLTIGHSQGDAVLLNLESVGTLMVTGPPPRVADVLRAFAAELAFAPISTTTTRTLCLADTAMADAAEAGSMTVETSPDRVARLLRHRMAASRPLVPSGSATAPGSQGDPFGEDPIEVVLTDTALAVPVHPWSGAALITAAAVERAGATLQLDEDGTALLLPERLSLVPQTLTARSAKHLIDAMRATDVPDADPASSGAASGAAPAPSGAAPGTWPGVRPATIDAGAALDPAVARHPEPTAADLPRSGSAAAHAPIPVGDESTKPAAAVIDLRDERTSAAGGPDRAVAAGPAPRIMLLGEVRVENAGGRAESSRIGRLSETAAFVLLNPGSRPSDLQAALWPGRRSSPQTCRQMISRTRTWLGRTDAGEPYLMAFSDSDGRLRLRPEVTSDWEEFQRLAEAGFCDGTDTENLNAALALVRGRPFGSVASRELPWADLHINDMLCLITDVAHELATRHLQAGRTSRAREAALRGLLTQTESEVLEEIVARTAP